MPSRPDFSHLLPCLALLAGFGFIVPVQAQKSPPLEELMITHAGEQRRVDIFGPVSNPSQAMPLVIVLHGGGGNGENAVMMTGFSAKAQQAGFIVAYPYGSGRLRNKLLTWNAGHCCGYAMQKNIDDVGFISKLIDTVIKEYHVDPQRVYVTGMSNGGMMAHRIGIELSHKVAAIAPVVAALFGDEPMPAAPVSVIAINGALDKSVPMAGGLSGGRAANAWDGTPAMPGVYQSSFWAKANACEAEPAVTVNKVRNAEITEWRYSCSSGRSVVRYVISDNGHAWPGGNRGSHLGDEPSEAMQATEVIWEFFKQHRRVNR